MWIIVYKSSGAIADKLLFESYEQAYQYKIGRIQINLCGNPIEVYDFICISYYS